MTVEDGTGDISVRMWLETASDDTGKSAGLEYVDSPSSSLQFALLTVAFPLPSSLHVAKLTRLACSLAFPSQGQYVRVVGTMKSFNNKRSVNATICKPVTDFNECIYHNMDVVRVHLYHTRGPPVSMTVPAKHISFSWLY